MSKKPDLDIVAPEFETVTESFPPTKPKSPRFFMLLAIGLLAGGGVGFILGLLAKGMIGIVQ